MMAALIRKGEKRYVCQLPPLVAVPLIPSQSRILRSLVIPEPAIDKCQLICWMMVSLGMGSGHSMAQLGISRFGLCVVVGNKMGS